MKTIRVGTDELTLATSEWRKDGEPVLFVHGFSHTRRVWDPIAGALDERLRPLAHDLRGHGESDWSIARHYTPGDHAGDIAHVLDAFEIERAALVAHSLGGNAATLFAAAHPERVSALVLVDTGPCLAFDAVLRMARDVGDALQPYATPADYAATLATTHRLADPAALQHLAETSLVARIDRRFEPRLDPALLNPSGAEDFDAAAMEATLWSALDAVICPTLLVRGASSAMLSEAAAESMVRRLRDGARVDLPGAGHAVALDAAPALAAEVERFLCGRVLSDTEAYVAA